MLSPLVLTGGPAVGKSTTARLVAQGLSRAAVVDVDDIRQLVVSGAAAPWQGTEGLEQQRLGVQNACALARRFHEAGFEVVVADVLSRDTLVMYRRLLPGCLVVRLHAEPAEARRRAATRTAYLTDVEFADLQARDLTEPPSADHHLDVTTMGIEDQAHAVAALWGRLGAALTVRCDARADRPYRTGAAGPVPISWPAARRRTPVPESGLTPAHPRRWVAGRATGGRHGKGGSGMGRVLLTGGSGGIGTAVVDALVHAGHDVTAVVRGADSAARVGEHGATAVTAARGLQASAGQDRSTSYSSRDFWGEAWAGFELDLPNTLATLAPAGLLTETISAYFVVGRNP